MDKSIDSLNSAQISSFLGVDFGKAKIGLALADSETRMAFAYDTIKNDGEFFSKLGEIIKKENVKTIVIGITRHEKDQKSADEKVYFGEKIEKEFEIAVMFEDEMFTTKMAQDNIKLRGGRNIAQTDDKEAARIILQSWLDRDVQATYIQASSHVS
jgi:putative Holliday junction resolvase